jgi:hypothetical protein
VPITRPASDRQKNRIALQEDVAILRLLFDQTNALTSSQTMTTQHYLSNSVCAVLGVSRAVITDMQTTNSDSIAKRGCVT